MNEQLGALLSEISELNKRIKSVSKAAVKLREKTDELNKNIRELRRYRAKLRVQARLVKQGKTPVVGAP